MGTYSGPGNIVPVVSIMISDRGVFEMIGWNIRSVRYGIVPTAVAMLTIALVACGSSAADDAANFV